MEGDGEREGREEGRDRKKTRREGGKKEERNYSNASIW